MLDALREVLDNLVYARSECYSAYEETPDYECNSSGRSYISQADSYLDRAADDLETVIELIEGLVVVSLQTYPSQPDILHSLMAHKGPADIWPCIHI